MLTIFSVPKPFKKHTGIIQKNAIKSWQSLPIQKEIILLGDEQGTQKTATKLNLRHTPQIKTNSHNTPLLDDIFKKAQTHAKYSTLCYINTDIILLDNFTQAVKETINKFPSFLLSGQRTNLEIKNLLSFSPSWQQTLLNSFPKSPSKKPTWIDYFVFPKNTFSNIPSFALGRTFWDKWLLWQAKNKHIPLIDASKKITAIHQKHDYSHTLEGTKKVWRGTEAKKNLQLAGGWSHGLSLNQANYLLTQKGFIKNKPKLKTNLNLLFRKTIDLNPLLQNLAFIFRPLP